MTGYCEILIDGTPCNKVARKHNGTKCSRCISRIYRAKYTEKVKAQRDKYYQENKESCLLKMKQYYQKNKRECHVRARIWEAKNKERVNARVRASRAAAKAGSAIPNEQLPLDVVPTVEPREV